MSGHRIAYPNSVLLIDGEMERSKKQTARRYIAAFAHDSTLRPIPLRKEHELVFR